MSIELCVVGAGECYEKYILPADALLNEHGVSSIRKVVDVKDASEVKLPAGAVYIKREHPRQPLDELLSSSERGIVVLSHPNNHHTPDAENLIKHGHRVALEKPYSITPDELQRLERLAPSGRLSLIEYYHFGKAPQLHILSGTIPKESFFFSTPGLLTGDVDALKMNAGRLTDIIGQPMYVQMQFLEGANDTGNLMQRDDSTSIAPLGGGVISDDGLHCFAIVTSLEDLLGRITGIKSINAAVNEGHQKHFMEKGHPITDIAETYADIQITTETAPVRLMIGKYCLGWPNNGRNQRSLIVIGAKGRAYLDLSSCTMAVHEGDSTEARWKVGIERVKFPRYYAVIRAAVEELEGRFASSLRASTLKAQEHVLTAIDLLKSSQYGRMPTYRAGAEVKEISSAFAK